VTTQGEDPGHLSGPGQDPGRGFSGLAWSFLLNAVLVAAFVLGAIPIVAIVHGFIDLVVESKHHSGADWVAYGFAFTGLFLGAVFFAYAVKYYLSTAMVLLTTLVGAGARNGNGGTKTNGNGIHRINGNGNGYHLDLGYHPFVSVHVAAYNEKRVIERLLTALSQLDYPEYEVVVVDDSSDESVQILQRWVNRPRFKILHRTSRAGFKGGALREALKVMDPRTEYVVVFDADSVPFPDSIERLLALFYRVSDGTSNKRFEAAFGRTDPPSEPGQIKRRLEVAAVQSYQWHVLNKSESWLTEAVRAEYAGSYMIERPFQDAIGSLKMIAGTAYMIRADVLREAGWGTSITEDWELTLKLYARGYKVVYTPWAETPAECVSTFSRLARQRMRWAEGHTHNVRKWFVPIMRSPSVSPIEKLEFLYDSSYYLQAGLFVVGSVSWIVSELFFRTHVPGWTALLGWSLLFSNVFALPLMNLAGLILEEAPARDVQGVAGALVLSFALVPFQGWAAFKGLISKDEGPLVPHPEDGPRHRRGQTPAAAGAAAAMARRSPAARAAMGSARKAPHPAAGPPREGAEALARLGRGRCLGGDVRFARHRLGPCARRQRGGQPAVSPRHRYSAGLRREHGRSGDRNAVHGLCNPVGVGWSRDDLVVHRPPGPDDRLWCLGIHHVLDRRQRHDQRHGQHRGGRVCDVELRAVRGGRSQRRHDLDGDLRVERHEHHQPVHGQHEREPAAARDPSGRIAVHPGDAHAQHRRQAVADIRRDGRACRHEYRAAEHRGP